LKKKKWFERVMRAWVKELMDDLNRLQEQIKKQSALLARVADADKRFFVEQLIRDCEERKDVLIRQFERLERFLKRHGVLISSPLDLQG